MRFRVPIVLGFLANLMWVTEDANALNDDDEYTFTMQVSAALEPQPALKYHLLVPPSAQQNGNAAIYYHRVFAENSHLLRQLGNTAIREWVRTPFDQLPLEQMEKELGWLRDSDSDVYQTMRSGAHCRDCDWQDDIQRFGFDTRLSGTQQARNAGRVMALAARLRIAHAEFDSAVEALCLGYSLSRHFGRGPCLVQGLNGTSLQRDLDQQLRDLIELPHSPNLYWALSPLAAQPVDFHYAASWDARLWEYSVPTLGQLDQRVWTQAEAEATAERIWRALKNNGDDSLPEPHVWADSNGPAARRDVLQRGVAKADVDEMPVLQIVMLSRWRQFQDVRDDCLKWQQLPLSFQTIQAVTEILKDATSRQEGDPFVRMLTPLIPCMESFLKAQRETRLLVIIEALRLHAATHGHWPATLEEIDAVPLPSDPATGTPFPYTLHDGVACLFLPPDDRPRYELTLRQPDPPQE